MTPRRGLLLAIIVYVTLDLSWADMPGAFVFDPAVSVESTDVGRARPMVKIGALPTPSRGSSARLQQPRDDFRYRLLSSSEVRVPWAALVKYLARATTSAPPSSSEDPH